MHRSIFLVKIPSNKNISQYVIFTFRYFAIPIFIFLGNFKPNNMQPVFLKVDLPINETISFLEFKSDIFYDKWHFHPEFELFYVKRGDGLRLVGDNIKKFGNGDLVLLGPNIPHTWKCDDKYYNKELNIGVEGFVAMFPNDFESETYFKLPEMQSIKEIIQKSKFGLEIIGSTKIEVIKKLQNFESKTPFKRVLIILEIFNLIAESQEYKTISSPGFIDLIDKSNSNRINKVFDYILENFTNVIKLEDISELVCLTPTSFCRFFRKHTQKSFSRYLNEVRISYACKLLIENNFSITRIGYESGFQNLSNFNRQFKNIMEITPKEYFHHKNK